MNTNDIMNTIVQNAAVNNSAADDYINPTDGLKYCGKCHTPKEAYFPDGMDFGGIKTHATQCRCAKEQREKEEQERIAHETAMQISQLRMDAFKDIPAAMWRFDQAAVHTPQLEKAQKYVKHWEIFHKSGQGLLLFGGVGTGKSYAAGCIANALIDRKISVLFVHMTDVINRMQGNFGADRENYLKSLMRPDLLILDDLGAERNTTYGKERVFDVINHRRLSCKPMIITTNISVNAMQKATDLDDRRIYDRILEVCTPIAFTGESFRKSNAAENLKKAAQYLNGSTI